MNILLPVFLISFVSLINYPSFAQDRGLVPTNSDGFETGDWRNFRPHYIGNSSEWIRPEFKINETDPLSGSYSLQWQGTEEEHEWIKISNAFYFGKPVKVTMDFRVNDTDPDWSVGLFLMETFDRYTGLRLTPKTDGQITTSLLDLTKAYSTIEPARGHRYRLSVLLSGPDEVRAWVTDSKTEEVLVELEGFSSISPEALGIYVYTGKNSEAVLDFDNISVDAAPYRMKSGSFVRSPQFVVLPRQSDMEQDQGNWVGAQSTMKKDGRYLMWYRLRDNQKRGKGYGVAESTDGIHWIKHENNPVLTYDPDKYSSSEKISVIYVDGLYRAWYTVNAPNTWYIAHATSKDGLDWDQHGLVIDDTYTKDAVVLYVDDIYYLYSIRDNNNVGIHTSKDGVNWELKNTIPMGVHRHVAATYVKQTGEFHLYTSGGFLGVSRAASKDGISFGPFRKVMEPSNVGLDDWQNYGVTYLSFLTDEYGRVDDDRELPVYYQARNTWDNNIPGWLYHGGERVVLAGYYEGLYIGVDTTILPYGGYKYHSFPFEIPKAKGLSIHASREVMVHMEKWQTDAEILGKGHLNIPPSVSGYSGQVNTQVEWYVQNLEPGAQYELEINHQEVAKKQADDQGTTLFTAIVKEENEKVYFRILRSSD